MIKSKETTSTGGRKGLPPLLIDRFVQIRVLESKVHLPLQEMNGGYILGSQHIFSYWSRYCNQIKEHRVGVLPWLHRFAADAKWELLQIAYNIYQNRYLFTRRNEKRKKREILTWAATTPTGSPGSAADILNNKSIVLAKLSFISGLEILSSINFWKIKNENNNQYKQYWLINKYNKKRYIITYISNNK